MLSYSKHNNEFIINQPTNMQSITKIIKSIERTKLIKNNIDYRLINQYILLKQLGSGSYGRIRLTSNILDNNLYALKIFSKSQLRRKREFGRPSSSCQSPAMTNSLHSNNSTVNLLNKEASNKSPLPSLGRVNSLTPIISTNLPNISPNIAYRRSTLHNTLDTGNKLLNPPVNRCLSLSDSKLNSDCGINIIPPSTASNISPNINVSPLLLPQPSDTSPLISTSNSGSFEVTRTPTRRNSNLPPPMLALTVTTALDKVKKEIEILEDLIHPNIMQLFSVISSEDDDKIYMVLEVCLGGQIMQWDTKKRIYFNSFFSDPENLNLLPLSSSLGGLTKLLSIHFFIQLVDAVSYCHSQRVVHRDIKPDNLMLSIIKESDTDKPNILLKLGDFGVANRFSNVFDRNLSDSNGTYSFISPEACSGLPFDAYNADIWSLGVTLYCFIYGKLPFYSDNASDLFDLIQYSELVFPEVPLNNELSDPCSQKINHLLSRLLEKDPTRRITLEEILELPIILSSRNLNLDFTSLVNKYFHQYNNSKDFEIEEDDYDYDSD